MALYSCILTHHHLVNPLCIIWLLPTPKVHFAICMDLGIPHRESTLCEKDFHLRFIPAQHGEVNRADDGEELFAGCAVVHSYQSHNSVTVSEV